MINSCAYAVTVSNLGKEEVVPLGHAEGFVNPLQSKTIAVVSENKAAEPQFDSERIVHIKIPNVFPVADNSIVWHIRKAFRQ